MTKEIPILYSTLMVQALLDGRKTMTRRLKGFDEINNSPDEYVFKGMVVYPDGNLYATFWNIDSANAGFGIKCPYGKPGDLLWVRESHYAWGKWEREYDTRKAKMGWRFKTVGDECYTFNEQETLGGETFVLPVEKERRFIPGWYKRPSIHMPKEASRIWLEVTDVRVERLQDISEEDAKAEGVEMLIAKIDGNDLYMDYVGDQPTTSPRVSFETLWQSINGPESWDANPWVWVISFKTLSTTGKPQLAI